MDKPTPVERIEHILAAISSIREFMNDATLESFEVDVMLQSAVKYKFLIIGEAIRYVDQSILDKYPYPWHIPRSFRNYIIHAYHGIKIDRIYFATQDLGDLEKAMTAILRSEF